MPPALKIASSSASSIVSVGAVAVCICRPAGGWEQWLAGSWERCKTKQQLWGGGAAADVQWHVCAHEAGCTSGQKPTPVGCALVSNIERYFALANSLRRCLAFSRSGSLGSSRRHILARRHCRQRAERPPAAGAMPRPERFPATAGAAAEQRGAPAQQRDRRAQPGSARGGLHRLSRRLHAARTCWKLQIAIYMQAERWQAGSLAAGGHSACRRGELREGRQVDASTLSQPLCSRYASHGLVLQLVSSIIQ